MASSGPSFRRIGASQGGCGWPICATRCRQGAQNRPSIASACQLTLNQDLKTGNHTGRTEAHPSQQLHDDWQQASTSFAERSTCAPSRPMSCSRYQSRQIIASAAQRPVSTGRIGHRSFRAGRRPAIADHPVISRCDSVLGGSGAIAARPSLQECQRAQSRTRLLVLFCPR